MLPRMADAMHELAMREAVCEERREQRKTRRKKTRGRGQEDVKKFREKAEKGRVSKRKKGYTAHLIKVLLQIILHDRLFSFPLRQPHDPHLHDLPLNQMLNDRRHDFDDLAVPEAGEGDGGAGEEEVAAEDGELVAEGLVGGGDATAGGGLVDDVVVEEGGGVDHLGDLGEAPLGLENGRVRRVRVLGGFGGLERDGGDVVGEGVRV